MFDSGQRRGEEKLLPLLSCAREEAASTTICQLLTFTDHGKDKPCEARKEKKEEGEEGEEEEKEEEEECLVKSQRNTTCLPRTNTLRLFTHHITPKQCTPITVSTLILVTPNSFPVL